MKLSFKYYKVNTLIFFIVALIAIHSIIVSLIPETFNWIPSVSAIAFISFVLIAYDKKLWKYFPYLLNIKDVSGRYEGTLKSNYNGGKEIHIIIEISQTSSYVYIRQFSYDNELISCSESINEHLIMKPDGSIEISFAYKNDGIENSNTINEHKGFCVLNCSIGKNDLKGYYFSNREEPTKGTIETKFVGKKLKGTY
ncbi:MAG: hypothetical protein JXR69_05610 [Candidatus Delongbacteria bacterium]|nr:hypothetical protein [Candidatus Delongbacteria bacterium]